MELVSIEHLTKKSLPWKETLVIPIGDVQHQSNRDAVDWKRLQETVDFGVQHGAYYIGMADMIDLESPSNRRALQNSGVYDSVVDALDAKAEELEEELLEVLKPTKGRWLGLLEGHHFHVHQDGTTTDQRLARELGAPFLGTSAYVNLTFESKAANHWNPRVNIWAHHGRGGGKLLSGPINQLEHVIKGFDADIYLVGHHHKSGAMRHSRVYPVFGPKVGVLDHRDSFLVACGSYLKGFVEGNKREGRANGLYAERGMMNPLSLGGVKIWLRPKLKRRPGQTKAAGGQPYIDISVEI
ncbi:MAG: hypothetical protein VW239_02550 [Candidatus Nanopelagicales bacterium]